MDASSGAPKADVLIAATFSDIVPGGRGGGLFAMTDGAAQRIDGLSTMGLACDGRRVARVLRCNGQDAQIGELLIYDARGVQRYLRLDEAASVHDIAWDGDLLVVVSTWHNAVRWFSPAGEMLHEIRYPGPPDAWHINAVAQRDGEWFATMFGPIGALRASSPGRTGRGRLVNLTTGVTVADGLTAPHTPRWLDGAWLICNSGTDEVLEIDETSGGVVRRVVCGGFTRGLTWDDSFLFVGTSRRRRADEPMSDAELVVVDRGSWSVVDRIVLPGQEVYELAFVPQTLHEGLRRGFDANPARSAELRQLRAAADFSAQEPRALWPSGDPLPWDDFRCTIACTVPDMPVAGSVIEIPISVTNDSRSFFTSAPPAPISVSYKWRDRADAAYLSDARAVRTLLPRTIFPGETIEVRASVVVPDAVGPAIVRLTLVQEGVTWFDEQHPDNALERCVEIAPVPAPHWREHPVRR